MPGTKVGHAGTLDPAASGVVVICLGAYTRLAFLLQATDKEYEGIVLFGRSTDTFDLEGRTVRRAAVPADVLARVERALPRFQGMYCQEVPRYSAAKWKGLPRYRWARRGASIPAASKQVTLRSVEVWQVPGSRRRIGFRLVTGSGFYVRAWAHDLGEALGIPALLARLQRTRVGPWSLDRAVLLDRLCPSTVAESLVTGLRAFPWVQWTTVDPGALTRLRQGVVQHAPSDVREGPVLVVDPDGVLCLLASVRAGALHPRVVLPHEGGSR